METASYAMFPLATYSCDLAADLKKWTAPSIMRVTATLLYICTINSWNLFPGGSVSIVSLEFETRDSSGSWSFILLGDMDKGEVINHLCDN